MDLVLATLLFILLSPGLIVTLPPGKTGSLTSNLAVLVHAVIFFIVQKLVGKGVFPFNYVTTALNAISNNPSHLQIAPILATLVFMLLSPGFVFQLPPEGPMFFSQTSDVLSILIHGVLYYILMKIYIVNTCPCSVPNDGSVAGTTGTCRTDNTSGIVPWLNCQLMDI